MLMTAERTRDGLIHSRYKQEIEEMDRELTGVIEDFTRAVDVEVLRLTKKSGKHVLPRFHDSSFYVIVFRANRAGTDGARACV